MKFLTIFSLTFIMAHSFAQTFSGQLSAEDQKYYKNESGAGMNQLERLDSSVKEINKIHGEIAALKSEVAKLKNEIEDLKKKSK